MRGRTAGVMVLATVLSLAGCAREVARGEVEQSIREAMADQGVPVLTLACPESLPAEMDATIVCDVQLGGTDPLGAPVDRIKVVVTAVEADEVRYRLQPLAIGQETDEDRDRDTSTG